MSFFEVLLFLYLAVGPVAWFATSTIGVYKRILLVLIIVFSIPRIKICFNKDFRLVLIAYICLFISVWINGLEGDIFNFSSGYIENIFFFIIGSSIASSNSVMNKITPWTYYILAFFCLLTISNFAIGIPSWTSPSMQMIEEEKNIVLLEYDKLYQTGFSWSRSGWGMSTSLYLPLLFLNKITDQRFYKYILFAFLIIFASLVLSANRSGLLGFLVVAYLLYKNYDIHNEYRMIRKVISFSIIVLIILFSSFFIELFRLNSDNISANRLEMYSYLPTMLTSIGFWGFGDGSSFILLSNLAGLNFQMHNTIFRGIIEYGWLYGFFIVLIMYSIVKRFFKCYRNDRRLAVFGAILVSGVITSMFEPGSIFGFLGGYSLWWLAYGIFSVQFPLYKMPKKM